MKKVSLVFAALLTFLYVSAQSNKEEIDLFQSVFGMEKKAMVAEFVTVQGAQADAFWTLYDQYEDARKELGRKRIELLTQYVENYPGMTNEFAESWSKEVMALTKSTDKLLQTYFTKVQKATNSVVALQFWQVEGYILSAIRISILEGLPLPEIN